MRALKNIPMFFSSVVFAWLPQTINVTCFPILKTQQQNLQIQWALEFLKANMDF